MAKEEYVKISPQEQFYGKKNLLQSQYDMINSFKHQKEYSKLRKQEITLKIRLKKKIEEALSSIQKLDRTLPKSGKIVKSRSNLSYQNELELIKHKLEQLQ